MAEPGESCSAQIVLASTSPRRRELLSQLGVAFDVLPVDIDEALRPGEHAPDYVRRLAAAKAAAVTVPEATLVIAADTTVEIDGTILGKPSHADDARRMLRMLSGRTHQVHTGLAVRRGGAVAVDVVSTFVRMAPITPDALEWYLATGEPDDKAGGYAIQGSGAIFVESVRGSVTNVVGLPLMALVALARSIGVDLTSTAFRP